ncbi:MAG: type II toxin-antitoxin system HicA family toxin [Anaerolineae bacterium]|nr:type II toxin-antitoxin system HicA family toxin [Anaerolineae bacterium]
MTKREKRLQKIRQNPRNVRYDDLITVLEDFGFTIHHGKGSHIGLRLETEEQTIKFTIVKPHETKFVKSVYVKMALKEIDRVIEASESEEEDGSDE